MDEGKERRARPMSGRTWTLVAVMLPAACLVGFLVLRGGSTPGARETAPRVVGTAAAPTGLLPLAEATPEPRRAIAGQPGHGAPPDALPWRVTSPPGPSHARVVDLHGRAVPDLELRWPGSKDALSNGQGRVPMRPAWIDAARSSRWPHVVDGSWSVVAFGSAAQAGWTLVVGRTVRAAGRVVTREGRGVAGAHVEVRLDLGAVPTLDLDWDSVTEFGASGATTDAVGDFDLGRVVAHPAASLTVTRRGGGTLHGFAVPRTDRSDLALVLPPMRRPAPPEVFGQVFGADGAPVEGATVRFGQAGVTTGPRGEYRLAIGSWPDRAPITAALSDGRFALQPAPARAAASLPGGAGPTDLRLPRTMARIGGRVLDPMLRPVGGLEVFLLDATRLGSAAASLESPPDRDGRAPSVVTDGDGRFEFPRVLDRPYHVRFLDGETLWVHDELGVRPGPKEVRILLPERRVLARLRGICVDALGAPVPGARVALAATVARFGESSSARTGRAVRTGPNGEFVLWRVPANGIHLSVTPQPGRHGDALSFPLDELDVAATVRLEVELRCEVVLRVGDGSDVTHVEFRDGQGDPLAVTELRSGVAIEGRRAARSESGAFPVCTVSQRAARILVFAGERELRGVDVRLQPTRRNRVDL